MKQILDEHPDRIAELFADKTVFITGGTGFVGKALIEKLLRCCPKLWKIFVLVRAKKEQSTNQRMEQVFKNPLFDRLKALRGRSVLKKMEALPGDASKINLGLSKHDLIKITQNTEFIYNCCATTRFDEPLRSAVFLNVRAVRDLLKLAKKCQKLLAFCHVSTTYCHLKEKTLYEKTYPSPADPHKIIQICELLSDNQADKITKEILADSPNTYAFTKALAEGLVSQEMKKIPIIIVRPSIVIPSYGDPIAGWTDNLNGPTGMLIAAGKGLLRTMHCNASNNAEFIPVDLLVNALLCATLDFRLSGRRRIFNVSSADEHVVSWKEIIDMGHKAVTTEMPLNNAMWYPNGSMKKHKIVHLFCFYFYQWIPAVILDCVLIVLGYDPILKRIQRKIWNGYQVFEYYVNNVWYFNIENIKKLRGILNPKETAIYGLEFKDTTYYDYFLNCVHGSRLYLLNEDDNTIAAAKQHMKRLYWLQFSSYAVVISGAAYLAWNAITLTFMGEENT